MDFVKLSSDDYTPEGMVIEGYSVLIWTERFQEFGEFELKTFDLSFEDLLPEDSFVSHLETKEVMMVETHEINEVGEGDDAEEELTIRGRSALRVLEDRWIEAEYQKQRRMRRSYSPTSAAAVLLFNAVNNPSGKDVTRGDDDPETEAVLNDYPWTTKDELPKVVITETVTAEGELERWLLEEGILWPQLQNILIEADLGLRTIRPTTQSNGTIVKVDTALATRGTTNRQSASGITSMRFDVYSGTDRSKEVQFSQRQGHIDKPQYLKSLRDSKTMVEVKTSVKNFPDLVLDGTKEGTGWKRRILEFDAGSPELPPEPEKPKEPRANASAAQRQAYREELDKWQDKWAKWDNKRDRIVGDFKTRQKKAALRELKKRRRVDMFSGDISDLSPYKYKTHYDLGDTVTLVGTRGKTTKMIVSEYIRTEDSNGDRGIPGLVAP